MTHVDRAPVRPNWFAVAAGTLTALALGLLGFVGFLGYFGGPVYRLVPPNAPTAGIERGTVVVFLSGDMGINAGMGPRLIAALGARGMPVLAVNSLTAFGTRHTPVQIDGFVAATVVRALRLPGAKRVVLVGQSFGADMLNRGTAHLPPTLRPKVRGVVLLVPGATLLFKASPGGVLDGTPDASALPSARQITWVPLTCIQGREETHSLCPHLSAPNVTRIVLPGGHFLNYDVPAIVRAVWRGVANGR
ncbi:type IV secretory pathway VirJ component [Sphingomonas sp. BE138]|uniref:AcvB/VirJ family lysyl-phosphatidylglycerol hydrolase n=1 Tax=Sphingomonas sp. BE138 TaxID=2817845 RepID=UPI0028635937|nr:AcvB/VirJ family lysyl-phosphatidylglycerol hydrolase [Sphingomonas sp. BE138]MDR6787724.1 type IV secretory pathway VirJ component [Sphingomonas sp. BE138]